MSSYEHDGLGRYGDPLNPDGDLESLEMVKGWVKEGGVVFLSLPIGRDEVRWNEGRVYGRARMGLMTEGWGIEGMYGVREEDWEVRREGSHQPVFVLRNKGGEEGEEGEL